MCGFCAETVQFILRHERRHTLRFAALESDIGRDVRSRHPELGDVDSMMWVDGPGTAEERILIRSDAGLKISRYMGGVWWGATLGYLIPRPLRDAMYDLIARHRHRLVAQPEQCYVPPPAARTRFLDQPTRG